MDGFYNLFAMEVDPKIGFAELPEEYFSGDGESEAWRSSKGVIQVRNFIQNKQGRKVQILNIN